MCGMRLIVAVTLLAAYLPVMARPSLQELVDAAEAGATVVPEPGPS